MIQTIIYFISAIVAGLGIFVIYRFVAKQPDKGSGIKLIMQPTEVKSLLKKRIWYYNNLSAERKIEFEKRITKFLSEKKISGVDTLVTDEDRIFVAASAIIPMFAFPYYNYPGVKEILLYPSSFDKDFQTGIDIHRRNILGMVGDGFLKGHVLLSKPDLESAFDGTRHKNNVGIHEFIHLIDKADGAADGIPEILFQHSFALSWLNVIKKEINKIKTGHSDINPYALTNNAEFLSVVGEYFFDSPEKMKTRHPGLYESLVKIFNQQPDIG